MGVAVQDGVVTLNGHLANDVIRVTVDNGWVTLSGEVEWDYQRQAAYKDIARLGPLGTVGVNGQRGRVGIVG